MAWRRLTSASARLSLAVSSLRRRRSASGMLYRGSWLELIQEPESGLRERERRGFSVVLRACCDEALEPLPRSRSASRSTWALRTGAHGHLASKLGLDARNHLRGQEQSARELEKL